MRLGLVKMRGQKSLLNRLFLTLSLALYIAAAPATMLGTLARPDSAGDDASTKDPIYRKLVELKRQNRLDEALAFCNKCLREHPGSGKYLRHRAYVYTYLTEDEKGLADLRQAVKDKNLEWRDWYGIARVFEKLEQPKEAVNAFYMAAKAMPNPRPAFRNNARIHLKLHDWEAAESDLRKCIGLPYEPGNASTHFDLGKALAQQGKTEEALMEVNLSLTPVAGTQKITGRSRVRALKWQSDLYLKEKKYKEALASINQAIKESPLTRDFYVKRLALYELLKDKCAIEREKAHIAKLDSSYRSAPGEDEDRPEDDD